MPRIRPVEYKDATEAARATHDAVVHDHGRMTNMKSTLLHSLPAFQALMSGIACVTRCSPFLGERLTTMFSHAISAETDCLVCSTYFRRILHDSGEDPDGFSLDERETVVVEFGRASRSRCRGCQTMSTLALPVIHRGADRGADRIRGDDGGDECRQQRAGGGIGRVSLGVPGGGGFSRYKRRGAA